MERIRVPKPYQVRDAITKASPLERVLISLLGFSGISVSVIGDHFGGDGLRVSDVPDIQVEGDEIMIESPARIHIRGTFRMGGEYDTFLSSTGCRHLQAYLEGRLHDDEKLGPDSPLVAKDDGVFYKADDIYEMVVKSVSEAGYPWTPSSLRWYFHTQISKASREIPFPKWMIQAFLGG